MIQQGKDYVLIKRWTPIKGLIVSIIDILLLCIPVINLFFFYDCLKEFEEESFGIYFDWYHYQKEYVIRGDRK